MAPNKDLTAFRMDPAIMAGGIGDCKFPEGDEAALSAAWQQFCENLRDEGPLDWLPATPPPERSR